MELDAGSSRHLARVLRMGVGDKLELFDSAGSMATATIVRLGPHVTVTVTEITPTAEAGVSDITIAAAVPKGERADWMIEKLSELGCSRFIPLATERSVVLPEGKNKQERWVRIATESAKQSRRAGVMKIEPLTPLSDAVAGMDADSHSFVLATEKPARGIFEVFGQFASARTASGKAKWAFFVGPEGGWTEEEIELFLRSNVEPLRLTDTILRVETAAVATAAIAAGALVTSNLKSQI
jgi:16S rRNA (uracil1498-N3)-methyltransferase